jgi:hypothetical protein
VVPTLNGRIQTRVFLLLVLGIPWTLLVTPLAPHPAGATTGARYGATFWVLGEVIVVGCLLWEPLYHLLMQFRWEKDWPIMFVLLEGIPEGILAYVLFRSIGPSGTPPPASTATFLVHFVPLWFFVWLAAIGPLRVVFHRWRFRGGRIL